MSLLTVVQKSAARLGLAEPDSVISNTEQNAVTLLSFANQEGIELARRATWQALTKEQTFVTVAAAAQTSSIPSDFEWYIPETMFNRTSRRRVVGPLSSEEWQQIQSSLITRVNPAFRIRGNTILITPTPTAGNTVAYEYISNQWCESSGGTDQSAWAADTDVGLLDEELMTLGIVWRWKKAKGFDYSEEFRTYELQVAQKILRDGSKQRLSMDRVPADRVPHAPQTPETIVF